MCFEYIGSQESIVRRTAMVTQNGRHPTLEARVEVPFLKKSTGPCDLMQAGQELCFG